MTSRSAAGAGPIGAVLIGAGPIGAVLIGACAIMVSPGAALAAPASPSPSGSANDSTVTVAGTSFLTAAAVEPGQPVKLTASTGDYLYWSFEAEAGQTASVAATLTLPAAAARHGAQTWTTEVFDGLRRRQACTAGAQTPTAAPTDPTVVLGCTLRQIRSWAEPWSGDPLPGTYYVRICATDLPEEDLGQTIGVGMKITVSDDGDPVPEGGDLKAPLVPAVKAGKVRAGAVPSTVADPSASAQPDTGGDWLPDLPDASDVLPRASTRWIWTIAGGILAAVSGVLGFRFSRRPRRRRIQ